MSNRKVIENYYCDLNNLSNLLTNLVSSYRLLIGGACELNQIMPARRSDVKHALDRVNKMGDIIDELLKSIEHCEEGYIDYCKIKSNIMKCKIEESIVLAEIEDDIILKEFNSNDKET